MKLLNMTIAATMLAGQFALAERSDIAAERAERLAQVPQYSLAELASAMYNLPETTKSVGQKIHKSGDLGMSVQPVSAATKIVTTTAGNTVMYAADAVKIARDEVVVKAISAAVDSGECIINSEFPYANYATGCVIVLGGQTFEIALKGVAKETNNAIYFVNAVVKDVTGAMSELTNTIATELEKTGKLGPALALPFKIFTFTFDAAGHLVNCSVLIITDQVTNVADSASGVVVEVLNIPVQVLTGGSSDAAFASAGAAVAYAGCLALVPVDVLVQVVTWLNGERQQIECNSWVSSTFTAENVKNSRSNEYPQGPQRGR